MFLKYTSTDGIHVSNQACGNLKKSYVLNKTFSNMLGAGIDICFTYKWLFSKNRKQSKFIKHRGVTFYLIFFPNFRWKKLYLFTYTTEDRELICVYIVFIRKMHSKISTILTIEILTNRY